MDGATRILRPAAIAASALLLVSACGPDLTPQSLVTHFRVIALRATPASGVAGDSVLLETIMSDTSTHVPPVAIWAACFPLPGQSGRQCLEGAASPDAAAQSWQFLGLEPTASFVLPPVPEGERNAEVFIVFAACSGAFDFPDCTCPGPDCEDCLAELDIFDLCQGEDEIVYKSVKSWADPALVNSNPGIAAIMRAGTEWPEGEVPEIVCDPEAKKCEIETFGAEMTEGSAETYTEIRWDEVVEFEEQPYLSWFATSGGMAGSKTSFDEDGLTSNGWRPLAGAGTVDFWFVIYDGRGGVSWTTRQATIVDP